MADIDTDPNAQPVDENRLIADRRDKLRALRGQGIAFPNDFHPDTFAGDLQSAYEGKDAATIEAEARSVKVAGRIMLKRGQGKVSFIQIQERFYGDNRDMVYGDAAAVLTKMIEAVRGLGSKAAA